MKTKLEMMREFHKAFGHPIDQPELINDYKFIKLRGSLHEEEEGELDAELWNCNQTRKISPNLLKEGADLLYVIYGTFVALGLGEELDEAFIRVHESNMSKLGDDGRPIYREDGKVLKGPNYKAPDLGDLV